MVFSYCRNIRLSDTDAAGVIYFAQGLAICHEAYEEWLQSIGLNLQQILETKKIALPIVHAEIDFLRPIKFCDRIQIQLILKEVTETKFTIAYSIIISQHPDQLLAKALTVHVCINPQTRQRIKLPDAILEG